MLKAIHCCSSVTDSSGEVNHQKQKDGRGTHIPKGVEIEILNVMPTLGCTCRLDHFSLLRPASVRRIDICDQGQQISI